MNWAKPRLKVAGKLRKLLLTKFVKRVDFGSKAPMEETKTLT